MIEGEVERRPDLRRGRLQQDHRDQGARGLPRQALHGADRPAREDAGVLRHPEPCPGRARPHQPDQGKPRPQLLPAGDRQRRRARRTAPARLPGQREDDPHHPHHLAEALDRRRCPQHPQHRADAPDQLDDRVQADHRPRHAALRRQGLLHDLRLRRGHHHFSDPEWDGEPLEPDEPQPCPTCGQRPCVCEKPAPRAVPRMRRAPVRVSEGDPARSAASWTASARRGTGQGEACRRQRTHHPAHDVHDLLAPRRHADVRPAVHGAAVRQAAGVLRRRGRAARPVECARHAQEAAAGSRREGLWRRAAGRDAENHRRREERSLRRPGPRRLRAAAARPAKNAPSGPSSSSARTSTQSSRSFWTSCSSHYVRVGVQELDQEKLTPLLQAEVPQLHLRRHGRPGQGRRTSAASSQAFRSTCTSHR